MAGPEGAGDKLRGWREGDGSAQMHGKDRVWLSRGLGGEPGKYMLVCVCMILCERSAGVMRGRGQMLKIYLPVQPRGMAGGTAVGADDRSMGRGPRLSQSCWTVRRRGRVIGKRAAAVRAKRNQFARG